MTCRHLAFTLALGLLFSCFAASHAGCHAAATDVVGRLEPFEPANGAKLLNYHPHFQWRGPEMTLDPKYPGRYTGGIKAGTPRRAIRAGVYCVGPIAKAEFGKLQVGDRLAATHYRSGFLRNHDNDGLVLKDITLVDAPGAISGNGGRNNKVAYLHVDVVPDPRLPDSRLAGHASSEGGRIAAWIEHCAFHMLGDDNYNTG